jgi:hypothetical protein
MVDPSHHFYAKNCKRVTFYADIAVRKCKAHRQSTYSKVYNKIIAIPETTAPTTYSPRPKTPVLD